MDKPRTCALPACETAVPTERLFCGPHWTRLPQPLRDDVLRAWVAWVGTQSAADRAELISARRAAVAWLQAHSQEATRVG